MKAWRPSCTAQLRFNSSLKESWVLRQNSLVRGDGSAKNTGSWTQSQHFMSTLSQRLQHIHIFLTSLVKQNFLDCFEDPHLRQQKKAGKAHPTPQLYDFPKPLQPVFQRPSDGMESRGG